MNLRAGMVLGAVGALMLTAWTVRAYEVNAKTGVVTLASVEDFERCQREVGASDACLEGLASYVNGHPKNAFAAGKAVRLRFNHWVALRFFERAPSPFTPEQCADADLGLAVVSGLALPSDDPNAALASKIAQGPCWSALSERVGQALADASTLYTENACALYKKKNVNAAACAPKPATKASAPAPALSAKLANLDPRTWTTEPSTASLFRGADNEQVLLIRLKAPQDVVLLKFKGVRGPWNNTVVPAVERVEHDGKEYVARVDGGDWTVLTMEEGSLLAYPRGYDNGLRIFREALTDHPKRMAAADVQQEFAPITPSKKP